MSLKPIDRWQGLAMRTSLVSLTLMGRLFEAFPKVFGLVPPRWTLNTSSIQDEIITLHT
jgi:hypothetical protein